MLTFLLYMILGLCLLFLLIAPIAVRFATSNTVPPDISPMDILNSPAEIRNYLEEQSVKAEQMDFTGMTDLKWLSRDSTIYLRLMLNRRERDGIGIAYGVNRARNKNIILKSIAFSTEFSNGIEICTRNSNSRNVFPDRKNKIVRDFPKVKDLYELYELHQEGIMQYGCTPKIIPPEGRELEDFIQSISREYEQNAEVGYMYYDKSKSAYRPTWRGAFSMTYKLLASKVGLKTMFGIVDK